MIEAISRNDRDEFKKVMNFWQDWYRPDVIVLVFFSISVIVMLEEDLMFEAASSLSGSTIYKRTFAVVALNGIAALLVTSMSSRQ